MTDDECIAKAMLFIEEHFKRTQPTKGRVL